MSALECFKAYDIRGRIPDQINEEIAYRIARGYAQFVSPSDVALGYDIRLTSPDIAAAVTAGLTDSGVNVHDIGLCGTEEVYFATFHGRFDGGIMITASHNPRDYNGMKLVREAARPISADTGLADIRAFAEAGNFRDADVAGTRNALSVRDDFVRHLLGYVDLEKLRPLKLVVNPGNGGAGLVIDALERHLPFEFVRVNFEPDGNFPNGIPNPLLEENRSATAEQVVANSAAMGIAWDGDFDRCFLFDETGGFIDGYYMVGLLAEAFLKAEAGAGIIYDPRLTWNTIDIVKSNGGRAIMSKAGHAFIKETMRRENAVYGGEMSAHHYFRDFSFCDSGMIPWLLVAALVSDSGKPLSALVEERQRAYPISGEINRRIGDPARALAAVEAHFASESPVIDRTDGLSFEFPEWRFNIRPSNTEPVVRLNVEARGDAAMVEARTAEILSVLEQSD